MEEEPSPSLHLWDFSGSNGVVLFEVLLFISVVDLIVLDAEPVSFLMRM